MGENVHVLMKWCVNVEDHRLTLFSLWLTHIHPSLRTVCCLDGSLIEYDFPVHYGKTNSHYREKKTDKVDHVMLH